jgi:DNA processing protein
MTEREALIALNMLPKIGPIRVGRLMENFGSASSILGAPLSKLQQSRGIGNDLAKIIHRWEDHADLSAELGQLKDRGLTLLTPEDPNWPTPLRELLDAPLVLYVWGEITTQDNHAIAVVGSRRTTDYGRCSAQKLSFQIAGAGYTVISGLARGIDTAGHEGAIAAKGRTVAVLGSGLGQVYPPENMPLAERIADGHGALVSEFPLNTPPDQQTFPQRNRIVAGWCSGLLVVECPSRSGALITANLAGDYGRQVYAVPGPIDRPASEGCNALIRQGATLITDGAQILDDLSLLPLLTHPAPPPEPEPVDPPELGPAESSLLDHLDAEERQIDEIIASSGLPASQVSATLLQLEMKGLAKQLPGSYFVRLP